MVVVGCGGERGVAGVVCDLAEAGWGNGLKGKAREVSLGGMFVCCPTVDCGRGGTGRLTELAMVVWWLLW